MERQFLCFLTQADEEAFLGAIDAVDPGLVILPGKYVDTDDGAALLEAPERHTFLQAIRSQRRLYLAHRTHSRQLLLHLQEQGPRKGMAALDELRSDVLQLELQEPGHGRLAPARLAASVVAFDEYDRIRKGAGFGRWVARVLRTLGAAYPPSSVDFIHLAPGALAFAVAGGQLTYLEERVLPAPSGGRRQVALERIRG